MACFEILLSENDIVTDCEPSPIIDTPFCVKVNSRYFPDKLWTDYSYPVLCMWAEEILRNKNRIMPKYTLYFQDGPFWINVRQNKDSLSLYGINGRMNDRVEFEIRSTVPELLNSLLNALKRLEDIVLTNKSFNEYPQKQYVLDSIGHYIEMVGRTLA